MKEQRSDNRKHPRRAGNTAGSVLITVLGVSLILMLAGVTMVVLSREAIHRVQRTANYAQAQAVAEAGVADMVAKLGTNYTLWQSNTYTATFSSNGAYYVTTQPLTNGNVLITSDGVYMGVSNRTIMELLGTVEDYNNWLYNTNSAVMSGGEVEFSTAAFTMNGDVAANGDISGTNSGTFTGTISNNVTPPLVLPTFNFDSYRQMATNGGKYLEGNRSLSGDPLVLLPPPMTNGILYVNGDLEISGNSTFTGTIVVNGNIEIKNQFTQTQFSSNMPSLLSTGSIEINNKGTLNGVVYAAVKLEIDSGNITINGGVISGGETEIKNKVTINASAGYPVWDPKNPYQTPSAPIPGGWLK